MGAFNPTRRKAIAAFGGWCAGGVIWPGFARAEGGIETIFQGSQRWDPEVGLFVRKGGGPGYATRTTSDDRVHSTRDNADFAAMFLEYGGAKSDIEKVEQILTKVLRLQDLDETSKTFGSWPWFAEESLTQMAAPDLNWANFIGARLCEILWDHEAQLRPETVLGVKSAIDKAVRSIIKRNVDLGYTNVVAMAIRVSLMAGRLLQRDDFWNYGRETLSRFHDHTKKNDGFPEYNSPTYTITALLEFEALRHYLGDAAELAPAVDLWRRAWEIVSSHFHAGSGEWAGPHARAYSDRLQAAIRAQIDVRLGRSVSETALPLLPPRRAMLPCPDDMKAMFEPGHGATRVVRNRFMVDAKTKEEVWGTTWFSPDGCLGSVSIGCFWTQAHGVIAYWKGAKTPAVARVRLLKDGRDFASFALRSVQVGSDVVVASHPLRNSGDWHLYFDRSPDGFAGSELTLRISVDGEAASVVRAGPDRFVLRAGDHELAVATGPCVFEGRDVSDGWTSRQQGTTASVDLTIPLGGHVTPAKLVDTLFVVGLSLRPAGRGAALPGFTVHEEKDGWSRVSWGTALEVVAPRHAVDLVG